MQAQRCRSMAVLAHCRWRKCMAGSHCAQLMLHWPRAIRGWCLSFCIPPSSPPPSPGPGPHRPPPFSPCWAVCLPPIPPLPHSPLAGQAASHPCPFYLPFQARLNEVVKYREARAKLEGQEVFRYTRARRRRRNKDKEVRILSPPRAVLAAREMIEFGKSSARSRNSHPNRVRSILTRC
jgi:hypothetical protein